MRKGPKGRTMPDKNGRPQIALVTADDPSDRRSFSGTHYYMSRALQEHCGDVHHLGPVKPWIFTPLRARNTATKLVSKKRYHYTHSIPLAKSYARVFSRKLSERSYDLVFAIAASTEIAFLETDTPIVYTSDATFALMEEYYPYFSSLTKTSKRQGEEIERAAITRASVLLYPSQWAARSAVDHYGADPEKTHVIHYGANLEDIPTRQTALAKRRSGECSLLFLGVDWVRQGGDIALDTLAHLNELGLPSRLTICGCVPPFEIRDERVKIIPFLDKNHPQQRQELYELLIAADFILFPTRAEAAGIVLSEAAAFATPVIASTAGGIPSILQGGESGYVLPLSAGGEDYARLIKEIFDDDPRYERLSRSSRRYFEECLNWDTWAIKTGQHIMAMLAEREGETL